MLKQGNHYVWVVLGLVFPKLHITSWLELCRLNATEVLLTCSCRKWNDLQMVTFVNTFRYSQVIPQADSYVPQSEVELSVNEVLKFVSYITLQRSSLQLLYNAYMYFTCIAQGLSLSRADSKGEEGARKALAPPSKIPQRKKMNDKRKRCQDKIASDISRMQNSVQVYMYR